jgi:tetratricopeptide (TPR) repeat protein
MIRLARVLGFAALLGRASSPVRAAPPDDDAFVAFDTELRAWDLPAARRAFEELPSGPDREVRAAILALHAGDYDAAEAGLAATLAAAGESLDPELRELAAHYLAIARGTRAVLGGSPTLASADGRLTARFADPEDELLAPHLFAAMERAYGQIGLDTGVQPPSPIRFEFHAVPEDLAKVSSLDVRAIRTTGTVGITKHLKIMMVTPRAMLFGYAWLDTAVHEYVHYVITMRTRDRAPVWLQEGLAKLLERRWREPADAPLDLDESARVALRRAIEQDRLISFEQMHPSFALLPTQEAAQLAYAQVHTMLWLLRSERGAAGLTDLLDRVARGEDARDALAGAWGGSFPAFEAHWKKEIHRRTAAGDGGTDRALRYKQGGEDEPDPEAEGGADVFSHLHGGKARQHARLGVLLTVRGHARAAAAEYERARAASAQARSDPQLARRLGLLRLRLGDPAAAVPLLDRAARVDPRDANLAAAQARARRLVGDLPGAREAAQRAIAHNPFIPSLHCDLAELAADAATRETERALCRE